MNRTRTIAIAFSTLDGVIEDPDGRDGTPNGGWAFRHGPEAVAGDKFRLGSLFDSGVLLMGRKTWQQFSRLWPSRTDDFSAAMNRIPKLVVSRTVCDLVSSNVIDKRIRPGSLHHHAAGRGERLLGPLMVVDRERREEKERQNQRHQHIVVEAPPRIGPKQIALQNFTHGDLRPFSREPRL